MTVIQSDPSPADGRARSMPSGRKASGAEPADAWAQRCVQAASDQARVSVFGFPGWERRAARLPQSQTAAMVGDLSPKLVSSRCDSHTPGLC